MNQIFNMSDEGIQVILARHTLWLHSHGEEGKQADFSNLNLSEMNFTGFNFQKAIFCNTILTGAIFYNCNLEEADFEWAILIDADLRKANMKRANLRGAIVRNAHLEDCILDDIFINLNTVGLTLACPEIGSFTCFAKVCSNYCDRALIAVLEVPEDAKRCSATTAHCRCNKIRILRLENFDGSISDETIAHSENYHDKDVPFKVGAMVDITDFDENRWHEFSTGISFFMNRKMAINMQY